MCWLVIDSLILPRTGTVFSLLTPLYRSMKMIIVYKGNLYLKPGDKVTPADGKYIVINGRYREITLFNTMTYHPQMWELVKNISTCPGNNLVNVPLQACPDVCFIECPYGQVITCPVG